MGKNTYFVSHKKSKLKENGGPKLPLASDLVEGEIAINFGKDVETLSIKNESGDVVTFSSDNYYTEKKLGSGFTGENSANTVTSVIESNEKVTALALADLDERKLEESDLSYYYKKREIDSLVGSGFSYSSITEVITENEEIVSSALNDLDERKLDASAYTPTMEIWVSGSGVNSAVLKGGSNAASGICSVAEGASSNAIGNYSHAEGYLTTASGQSSHAEGFVTKANGNNSHAEGQGTTASGNCSHAEGAGTQANGNTSHAEGSNSNANGEYSHAEGSNTQANGQISHAEGNYTKANGNDSHAEGFNTTASGNYSHAEGDGTVANNESEHASGQFNVSNSASTEFGDSGNTLFSVGNGTGINTRHNAFEIRQNGDIYIVSGSSDIKLQDYIGEPITVDQDFSNTASTNPISTKAVYSAVTENELVWANAFVALSGTVSAHTANTEIHVTAADKTAWNTKLDASAIADFFDDAKYEDSGTTKVINFYHGNTIKATIDASDFIVDGMVEDVRIENGNLVIDFNTASGKQDISIPLTDIFDPSNYYTKSQTSGATELSTAFDAIDDLVGSGFTSSSITEVIIENERIVSAALNNLDEKKLDASAYTPSVELWVSGTGLNSVVLKGSSGTASGNYSVAEGTRTTASGNQSHAEGSNTTASGLWSHVEGDRAIASGQSSHAEGQQTVAGGRISHAEGYLAKANGRYSHAEGESTTATNQDSHAEGYRTTASGYYSHAEGYETVAGGSSSHAEGNNTTASSYASHAEGNETIASGSSSHAEGYSTEANGDYSHAEGRGTIASGDYSHAEGASNEAVGDKSHTEGFNTIASGDCSHAEGYDTQANDMYSHAEGATTKANRYASHAEGSGTRANGNYSHAEGVTTKANGAASHAEGSDTVASGQYSHAEGNSTRANNQAEHASGQYNVSNSASTTFGDSGNTLFSVGNGTADNARHNAFEIRQNGDIYITSGSSDIKLQDYIGSVETVTAITPSNSGSTDPIATKVVAENELTVSNALNDLNTNKADKSDLGGLKLVKVTQTEYDALTVKDPNTLYVIVN